MKDVRVRAIAPYNKNVKIGDEGTIVEYYIFSTSILEDNDLIVSVRWDKGYLSSWNIERHEVITMLTEKQFLADMLLCKLTKYSVPHYIHFYYKFFIEDKDKYRELFLATPAMACHYAHKIDKGPRDDTRTAACKDPEQAYFYAYKVDRCPHDETREAACRTAEDAYYYASHVDMCSRQDTYKAVCKDPHWKENYENELGKPEC